VTIEYKGFTLHRDYELAFWTDYAYTAVHEDYDGSEDSVNEFPLVTGVDIQHCKDQIDELILDK
jgi:hypothetical protein